MKNKSRQEGSTTLWYALIIAGLCVSLYQVWSPAYFLTTDGPVHVYNADILRSLFMKQDHGYYAALYHVNNQINANWLSHFILGMLLSVFDSATSEKILITSYLFLFLGGVYAYIRLVNKDGIFYLLAAFIFIFNTALLKGFYNFSFSMALFPWFLNACIVLFRKCTFNKLLRMFLISLLIFVAHPLGYIVALAISFFLLCSFLLSEKERLRSFGRAWLIYGSMQLPFGIWIILFNQKNNDAFFRWVFNRAFINNHLLRFSSFHCYNNQENIWCIASSLLLLSAFLMTILYRIRTKKYIHPQDGLLYGLVFLTGLYLFFPDYYPCPLMELRVQLFFFLTIFLFLIANLSLSKLSMIFSMCLFCLFRLLSISRIQTIRHTDDALRELEGACRFIKPETTLLGLNFHHHGQGTDGNEINSQNDVFSHAHQYLGKKKNLFILDNYEANTSYFPLRYTDSVNPYKYLCKAESLESEDPAIDINQYERTSGRKINYVLYGFFHKELTKLENTFETNCQIQTLFSEIYRSPNGMYILYERK